MANLYYRYGTGKSAELCITAYNYREQNGKVVIFNGDDNQPILSAVTGKNGTFKTDITDFLNEDDNLFEKGQNYQNRNISAILVDNAHLLPSNIVEQLYLITKFYDIPVLAYGNRIESKGALRFMELANRIEAVDGIPNEARKSQLHFYYGAMNCGKTTKLYCRAQFLERKGQTIQIIRSVEDREKNMIKSRSNLIRKVDLLVLKTDNLYEMLENLLKQKEVHHLLVDEAQFLTPEQVTALKKIQEEKNIPVSCYGLKTDFRSYTFPGSARLLTVSDCLEKLRTVCSCKEKNGASFNARQILNEQGVYQYTRSGEQVCIDGVVHYTSLCDTCYLKDVLGYPIDNPEKVLKILKKKDSIF